MKLDYSTLSKDGLVVYPDIFSATDGAPSLSARDFLDRDRDFPEIVGFVPNLSDFTIGDDCDIGAFEIKAQESDVVCVPSNIAWLLPTTKLILDDLYSHAGTSAAWQCQVSLQFFRMSYEHGQHLLFDRIHRHATEGKMVIYVATAIDSGEDGDPEALGTEFYAPEVLGKRINRAQRAASPTDFQRKFADLGIVAAPGGAIIRFSENTLHAAPDLAHALIADMGSIAPPNRAGVRRSLINIIASYRQDDGIVYGRSRPPNDHRPSPVHAIAERREGYVAAAERVLEARGAVRSATASKRAQ
ncbi:hypothetical protein [Methylocapsa acidiphila]|uniref:hypothetical protein n=1 Tax=Methylocapsa acidiphila TaxID=133552 RepID=UPI00041A363B|nr:hypothetical protein [Methylocapsa acidiphila]